MTRMRMPGAIIPVLAALSLAVAGIAQQPPAQPGPKQEPEAGGVFRLPSRMPEEPTIATGKEEPKEEGPKRLEFTGAPISLPYTCTEEEIQAFGMTCSASDPCPVYLDLAHIHAVGRKLFLTGNLHNGASTMASVLLISEDGGGSWFEPVERQRAAGLDQVLFYDVETGWISGQTLGALPRDPFLLLTTDGGKTWRKRPLFSETHLGAIDRFQFESRTAGTLLIDRGPSGSEARYERYETMTGGDSWMVREVSSKPIQLRGAKPGGGSPDWRIRADAKAGAHWIEKRNGARWTQVSAFRVKAGECQPDDSPLAEPPPEPEDAPAAAPRPTPTRRSPSPRPPSAPPSLKKK
ncbi:MAG: hypothetical protein R2762_05565 [Bryobacteraceae bacterium]